MNVLCVSIGGGSATQLPVVGCIYTVANNCYGPNVWTDMPGTFYSLEEMDPTDYYHESMFAPLSNINELELVNEKEMV